MFGGVLQNIAWKKLTLCSVIDRIIIYTECSRLDLSFFHSNYISKIVITNISYF